MKLMWKRVQKLNAVEYHMITKRKHFVVKQFEHRNGAQSPWFCLDWSSNLHRRFSPEWETAEECMKYIESLLEVDSYELRDHQPEISEAELERLVLLMEECSEVTQACSKIIRNGWEAFNPHRDQLTSNRESLTNELQDLLGTVLKMQQRGDFKLPLRPVHEVPFQRPETEVAPPQQTGTGHQP